MYNASRGGKPYATNQGERMQLFLDHKAVRKINGGRRSRGRRVLLELLGKRKRFVSPKAAEMALEQLLGHEGSAQVAIGRHGRVYVQAVEGVS